MSERLLAEEARRRAEVFRNLRRYLDIIVEVAREIDADARVYLFGSVAEGSHLMSSDIDVLVVTKARPAEVLSALWSRGIKDPFEVHVVTEDMLEAYRRRVKLVEIGIKDATTESTPSAGGGETGSPKFLFRD